MNWLDSLQNGLNKVAEEGVKTRKVIDGYKARYGAYDDHQLLVAYKEAGGDRMRKAALIELIKERGLVDSE